MIFIPRTIGFIGKQIGGHILQEDWTCSKQYLKTSKESKMPRMAPHPPQAPLQNRKLARKCHSVLKGTIYLKR